MSSGRLEAQITVPTGGWSASLSITGIGGPYAISFAAGATYYPSTFVAALETALDAASGSDGDFTVSLNRTDDTGTGVVTIAHATQTFTLTSVSAALLDLLGFASDLTPAALSFAGTSGMRGLWLPDCPIDSPYGAEAGHYEFDRSRSITPSGVVSSLVFAERRRHPAIRWSHVTRARARAAAESAPVRSFETWFRDTHGGACSYFVGSPLVRVYSDAADASPFATLYLDTPDGTAMERAAAPWNGLYPIEIGGYAQ